MRENDYGQIPLLASSMLYNYLYVPVLSNSTVLRLLLNLISCKFSALHRTLRP